MKTISEKELENGKELPGDGWFIIEGAGVFPKQLAEDVTVTENLAPEVLAAVAEAGVPAEGLFIDLEHESCNGGSTAARGWVKELALCGDDLAARIEWTAEGLPLIRGKIYKHFSTVYPCEVELKDGDTFTPTRLTGLTLTNMPNNAEGQPPISNGKMRNTSSASHGEGPSSPQSGYAVASGGKENSSPCTQGNNQTKTNNTMNPELLKALGLPDDATEEEVVARAAEMAQELADLRTAAADAAEGEAEAIINAEESEAGAELTEEEKQDVKELLLENRERGRRYLHALVQNKGNKPAVAVQNGRRYAGKPAAVVTAAREQKSHLALCNARAAEIVKEMKNRGEKPVFAVAFAQAKRELKKNK